MKINNPPLPENNRAREVIYNYSRFNAAYEKEFFTALKSELLWRLPFVYLIFWSILVLLFSMQKKAEPMQVMLPFLCTLLIIGSQFLVSKGQNAKKLYELLYLICSMTLIMPLGFLIGQEFNYTLLLLIFIAQLACWVIFPWPLQNSLFWCLSIFLYWGIVLVVQGFYFVSAVPLIFLLVLAVLFSRVAFQNLNLNQSGLFLTRLHRDIQDNHNLFFQACRLIINFLNLKSAISFTADGAVCSINAGRVIKNELSPLTAKSLYGQLKDTNQGAGYWRMEEENPTLQAFLFDCLQKHKKRFIYIFLKQIYGNNETETLLLVPLGSSFDYLSFFRLKRGIRGFKDIYTLLLQSNRNQVMSNNTVSAYGKALAEREHEVNQIVHVVNNNAQEIGIYSELAKEIIGSSDFEKKNALLSQIEQIEAILRTLTQSVSDIKLLREIVSIRAFTGKEQVNLKYLLEDLKEYISRHSAVKNLKFKFNAQINLDKDGVFIPSADYLAAVLRVMASSSLTRLSKDGQLAFNVRRIKEQVVFQVLDNGKHISKQLWEFVQSGFVQDEDLEGRHLRAVYLFANMAQGEFGYERNPDTDMNKLQLILPYCKLVKSKFAFSNNWVLLVDDNPQVINFYARIAEALNLKFKTASSYERAVAILKNEGKPKLMITDIQLENGSGLDLVAYLRSLYNENIPVIVVSGNDDSGISRKAYDAGASKYLKKPLGKRKLFSEIEDLLK